MTPFTLWADISAGAGETFTRISATFLNKYLEKGMDVFAATIRQPTFPEAEVKQMISEFVQYNNPRKMDISELANALPIFSHLVLRIRWAGILTLYR